MPKKKRYTSKDVNEVIGLSHSGSKSRKKPKTKAGKKAKAEKIMHEYKTGKLHSGSKRGPKVKSRKQAIAIMLHQTGQSKYK